jgi:hypothetical protein
VDSDFQDLMDLLALFDPTDFLISPFLDPDLIALLDHPDFLVGPFSDPDLVALLEYPDFPVGSFQTQTSWHSQNTWTSL